MKVSMIDITSSGSWDKTIRFLKFMESNDVYDVLDRYGRIGVDLLSRSTLEIPARHLIHGDTTLDTLKLDIFLVGIIHM
jgi:hypothetical protein